MDMDDDSGLDSTEIQMAGPDVTTTASMVGRQSGQTDQIIRFMERSLYEAAGEGNIDTFTGQSATPLHLILTPIKNTVLHIHITARCKKEKMGMTTTDFVENILHLSPLLLLQKNNKGEIPLHTAARYGDCDIVKVLIEHAKKAVVVVYGEEEDLERGVMLAARDMIRMTNKVKDAALHEAARFNHLDVVRLLIKEEDPEFSYFANDAGETPLYLAAERGYTTLVAEIVATCAAPTHGGPKGLSALHAAVINNDREIATTILRWKRSLTMEVDDQGWTPLHHAASCGYHLMVGLLLNYGKSAAYVVDRDGQRTALHIAANRGHTNIVKQIISRCPDCCELVDKRGWNVLHFAIQSDARLVVRFILRESSRAYLFNEKDENGNTPLHLVANYDRSMPFFISNPGVDKMAFNKENLSALDIFLSESTFPEGKGQTVSQMKWAGAKAGQRCVAYNRGNARKKLAMKVAQWKQEKGNYLIVAAFIATVTFAAGFTLPGGYIQDDKSQDQGTPILLKKVAFKVFVVTDIIGMVLSSYAVLCHLYLVLIVSELHSTKVFIQATYATFYAMAAMVIAFITGLSAVLEHFSPVAILAGFISSILIILFYHSRVGMGLDRVRIISKMEQSANN